jgi:hypothetical protein
MNWSQVLQIHKTLRGIGKTSLLVDRGESGYPNQFLPDGRILYPGEGLRGNQQPTKGNGILLQALFYQRSMRVFCREAVNHWTDLGLYRVGSVEYRLGAAEGRYIYWFTLVPLGQSG